MLIVISLRIEDSSSLPLSLNHLTWQLYLLFLVHHSFGWLLDIIDLLFLLLLGIMWWSPRSILIELLDNIRLALLVEFAFCYEMIPLIFLVLIVLLISRLAVFVLWKKLFGENEFWPIHIVWSWSSRTLIVVFAGKTLLSAGNTFDINVALKVQRVAWLI